jgi:hypothetical protein
MIMKKTSLLLLILIGLTYKASAQCGISILTVNNPSFEGTPQPHVTPPLWDICNIGTTPDVQPNSWGVTLPPYDGNSYVGFVDAASLGWHEGASQTLSSPMTAGITYMFTIELAVTASMSGGIIPGCIEMQVWGNMGGNSGCDQSELLWNSGDVFDSVHMDHWVMHHITFTPSQNWSHILYMEHNLGCTDQPYIMMDDLTPITRITGEASYLYNDYHTMCDGDSYYWHGMNYSTSITDTAFYTTMHGCDSNYILHLTANVVDVGVTVAGNAITANNTGAAYQWIDCNNGNLPVAGETGQSYAPFSNGSYAVIVTQGLCSDTSDCINVTTIGLMENNLSGTFNVFPNPANGSINIQPNQEVINATIRLVNVTGQIVMEKTNLCGKSFEFDISGQSQGIYYLEIIQAESISGIRIVKK